MNNNFVLMNDRVAKKIFKNSSVAKELTARVVSEVLHEDYNTIYNNLKLTSEEISFSALTVDNKADVMLEDNTMLVDIEICWTKGTNRQRQTDTYIYQLYISQLRKSKDYKNMKKIIQILIESYDFFHKDKLVYDVVFMEQDLHLIEDNFIHKYHINLAKLKKISYNKLIEENNKLGWLLYFLICDKKDRLNDIYKGDKFMEDVVKEAKEIAGDLDMDLYIPEEEVQRRDIEEAVNRGFQDGFQDGFQNGFQNGKTKMQTEMIINFYKNKVSIELISKSSGLSINEVEKIIYNSSNNN